MKMPFAPVAVVVLLAAWQDLALAEAIRGQVRDRDERTPVPDVSIVVAGEPGVHARTDRDGRFVLELPAGTTHVELIASFGTAVVRSAVDVTPDRSEVVILLDTKEAVEEIVIHDVPSEPARPRKPYQEIELPYSDEAILTDAWKNAWMLLFIDDKGVVQGVRFVKRPSARLDEIAVREALKMEFTPATDGAGRPRASVLLWKMEWKSYFRQRTLDNPTNASVLCEGTGPLNLDSVHPLFRECSPPDWKLAFTEPTYRRDGQVEPAMVARGQLLDDAALRRSEVCDLLAATRYHRRDEAFDRSKCKRDLTTLLGRACPMRAAAFIACRLGERGACEQLTSACP